MARHGWQLARSGPLWRPLDLEGTRRMLGRPHGPGGDLPPRWPVQIPQNFTKSLKVLSQPDITHTDAQDTSAQGVRLERRSNIEAGSWRAESLTESRGKRRRRNAGHRWPAMRQRKERLR